MDFDAFLSYSHGVDTSLATSVQDALQRLGKPWYRRRALRVFRDETGLSANPGLWSSITDAMARSDWLVLMASPDAAGSAWVNREVAHWLVHGDPVHLLVAVVDGSWEWDDAAGDFTDDSTAVPDALRGVFGEEPRHIDLRWARDESGLSVRTPRFRDQMAELAAPIYGVTKDELVGSDLREHRRTIRTARAAVAGRSTMEGSVYLMASGQRLAGPITHVLSTSWTDDGTSLLIDTDLGGLFEINASTGAHTGRRFTIEGVTHLRAAGPYVVMENVSTRAALFDYSSRAQVGSDFVPAHRQNEVAHTKLDPKGEHLLFPGELGVEIWDLIANHWRSAACRLAGRNLTREEWRAYMPDGSPYRKTCARWTLAG